MNVQAVEPGHLEDLLAQLLSVGHRDDDVRRKRPQFTQELVLVAGRGRWRDAQPGSCTERENLAGEAKGKGASGYHREAESTDAPERGGVTLRYINR